MSPRGVTAYSLVNATVRALYSNLLSSTTWRALVQAEDYDAVLTLLGKTVYASYLQLERPLLSPRRAVYQLRWHLADVYEKLIRVTPDPGKQLLIDLWDHYEVDNLKATLRGIEAGASLDQVRHLLYPMRRAIVLTTPVIEQMVRAGDIDRAIGVLRGTLYYPTLMHALTRYHTEKSLFPLEVALDLDYRRRLWQSIDRLKGLDHEQALRTLGVPLDADNLLWAIRYRVYHRLSAEEIINYTLPLGYQVQDVHIRAIANGEDIAAVVHQVYPNLAAPENLGDAEGGGLAQLERALQQHIVDTCRSVFLGNPFHIGVPLAYVWLNEYEIRNLTVIIEAKASQVSPDVFAALFEGLQMSSESS
ncbi:MAG: V-type ATPase subunit [Anaerolineae bacterium]|nr:V-type ATPase subunit [Anaerolineae bacterium]